MERGAYHLVALSTDYVVLRPQLSDSAFVKHGCLLHEQPLRALFQRDNLYSRWY